jgi:glycolate oxidase FAD binding subunit
VGGSTVASAAGAGVGGFVRPADAVLDAFAALIGSEGPVCVAGGRTQWSVGGVPAVGTRQVTAPAGVVSHQPAEMIVRVRAGTTVAAMDDVLAEGGQMVPLDPTDPSRATVGGVLAVGQSGWRRVRYGPLRDYVLEATFVSSSGQLIRAGGPVVKNVTGYDLCRLLVGSLGTLGLVAEVVLRCVPRPAAQRWLAGEGVDPFEVMRLLYRPSSILWDGSRVWVLLEGNAGDVAAQEALLGGGFVEVAAPPPLPGDSVSGDSLPGDEGSGDPTAQGVSGAGRLSLTPAELRRLAGLPQESLPAWVAEVGVGVVHCVAPAALATGLGRPWPAVVTPGVAELHRRLKSRFDPTGRLNPGRRIGVA